MLRFNSERLVKVLLILTLLSGCKGLSVSHGTAVTSGAGVGVANLSSANGLAGFKASVYKYAQTNCIECHGATQAPLFAGPDVNVAFASALNYVNFGSIPFSKFVTKANDAHCGSAPCTNNGPTMVQLIQQWQAAYATSGGGSSAPTGTTVLIGSVFTNAVTVPAPNPAGCSSPAQQMACSYDGLNNTMNDSITHLPPAHCSNSCWTKLRFPVALMTTTPPVSGSLPSPSPSPGATATPAPIAIPGNAPITRAWFEVDFAYDNYSSPAGAASYTISNPRIVSLDKPVYIHDVRMFINGVYQPTTGGEYQNVDMVVTSWTPPSTCSVAGADATTLNLANQALSASAASWLSPANSSLYMSHIEACNIPSVPNVYSTAVSATAILQVNDPTQGPADQISFSFDYLQPGVDQPCRNPALWLNNVYKPIQLGALQCLDCHRSGGNVTEAGQRFNMDDKDPMNCPAGAAPDTSGNCYVTGCKCKQADTQATVCQKFLQRSNLSFPSQSAIITQPTQGLNGMPAQEGFSHFEQNWINWINAEVP